MTDLLEGLNQSQIKAVTSIDGSYQVASVAGSGKTTVLTRRVAYMLNQGVNPQSILVTTYTKKAANELQSKLELLTDNKELTDDITIGTFHSIGYNILRYEYQLANSPMQYCKLISAPAAKWMMTEIFRDLYIKSDKHFHEKHCLSEIAKLKNNLISPQAFLATFLVDTPDDKKKNLLRVYEEYEKRKDAKCMIDYNDMLYKTFFVLRSNDKIMQKYQTKFQYILVDEAQDTNFAQYEFLRLIADQTKNIFIVGDDDQCQPIGEQVLTTDGYVNIEELNPNNHKVTSYDKSASCVVGLKNGYDFKVNSRNYDGDLIIVKSQDKIAKCTPNHRWIVKWDKEKTKDTHVVYLMKKDNKFRVGWCKLFKNDGGFHLGIRARLESADSAWILKTCKDNMEASKWESIISTQYGLPLIPFLEHPNNKIYSQKLIDDVFSILNNNGCVLYQRAIQCLNDFKLDILFPIWEQENMYERRGGNTINEIHAINLISDIMKIPIHIKGKTAEWQNISLGREQYSGLVYSLDVEKHHLYITNGLITHNSIYKFRGAEPEKFINFKDDFEDVEQISLEHNYRSYGNILTVANALIKNNSTRIEKELKANKIDKDNKSEPYYVTLVDEEAEAEYIVKKIKEFNEQGYAYNDITVLYRTNDQSRAIEDYLITHSIPYACTGGSSFYEYTEIRDIIAYLKLAVNHNDDESLLRIINKPSRYLSNKFLDELKIVAKRKGVSLFDAFEYVATTSKNYPRVLGFTNLINDITEIITNTPKAIMNVGNIITLVIEKINYLDYLSKNEDLKDEDNLKFTNLLSLQQAGKKYFSIQTFLDYVDIATKNNNQDNSGVQLMTIHKSKGLEFPIVFICGMAETILPHEYSLVSGNIQDMEEERRLAYVAITRAGEKLIATVPKRYQNKPCDTSRFLIEGNFKKEKTNPHLI